MTSVAVIRATARVSDWLYRYVPSVYTALYDAYKRRTEQHAIALIRRFVQPGDRVVDIGANVGFYTEVLAECVGAGGRVYAFEPDQHNFNRLAKRISRYAQVTPVQAAVGESQGSVDLYLSPSLNIDHRTYPTDELRATTSVPAVSLDRFLTDRSETIDFIKMDIQGGEHAALLGMGEVVARSPRVRILMEMWPFVHERYGAGTQALLELVESWGLEVHRIGASHELLGPRLAAGAPVPESGDPEAYFDVLCVRRGTTPG